MPVAAGIPKIASNRNPFHPSAPTTELQRASKSRSSIASASDVVASRATSANHLS